MHFELGKQPTLYQASTPWEFGNESHDPHELSQGMIKFMVESQGIGLAANQIGIAKQMFVMGSERLTDFPDPFAVFNPVIVESSETQSLQPEGCLTFPGLVLTIKRPDWIVAQYQDADGNSITQRLEGYTARCFQHEYDHLQGVCFVNRVSPLKLRMAEKKKRKGTR